MSRDRKIGKTYKISLICFWVNIIILFSLSLYFLFQVGINGKSITESDFTYERFGIIFILILIPVSLKFYHNRNEKLLLGDKDKYFKLMLFYYYLRLFIVDFTIVFNLVCFHSIGAMNFFYLTLIGIFSLLVCYPIKYNYNEIKK